MLTIDITSIIYNQIPTDLHDLDGGLLWTRPNLNISDLISKRLKRIERKAAPGKAAANKETYPN